MFFSYYCLVEMLKHFTKGITIVVLDNKLFFIFHISIFMQNNQNADRLIDKITFYWLLRKFKQNSLLFYQYDNEVVYFHGYRFGRTHYPDSLNYKNGF